MLLNSESFENILKEKAEVINNLNNKITELSKEVEKLKELEYERNLINDSQLQLDETENFIYKTMIDMAGDGFGVFDIKGKIVELNKTFCDQCGYTREEMLQLTFEDLLVQRNEEERKTKIEQIYRKGSAVYSPYLKRKDGTIWAAEIRSWLYNFKDGVIVSFISDVTDKRENERMLEAKLQREKNLLSAIPDLIFRVKREGVIVDFFSSPHGKLYVPPEVFLGKKIIEVMPEDVALKSLESLEKVFEYGGLETFDYSLLIDGVLNYFEARVNANKEINEAVFIVRDVSDQKNAENKIKRSENKYAGILRTSLDGFIIHDSNGAMLEFNDAYCKMSGYTHKELSSKNINDLIPEDIEKEFKYDIAKLIEKGSGIFETIHRRKDGSRFYLEVSAIVDDFEDKNIIMFLKDITEKKRILKELIEAKENAETMNKLKSSFLDNMSHELRTPLIGVIGYAELMRDMIHEKDVKEMVESIYNSGHRLLRSFNLILDLSRIESKKKETSIEKFDVVELVKRCIQLNIQEIAKKDLTIIENYENPIIYNKTDKRILESMINNLINNAAKFTHKGYVKISVYERRNNDNAFSLFISVKDTGIGISEKDLLVIFDDFRQASEGHSRSYEGLGLGLALAKKYSELLKGKIYCNSRLGEGSEFIIEIPSEKDVSNLTKEKLIIEENKEEPKEEINNRLYEILIVDDDPIVHNLIGLYVKNIFNLDSALNLEQTLEKIKIKHYDLVLMDINLGEKYNGIEVLKALRLFPEYENTPIIACTAYALDRDKKQLLSEGFDDYLSKPFGANDLKRKIRILLDK